MEEVKNILIIEFCNYRDYPIGGYLTFANNLKQSFGVNLILVGITTDYHDPVGTWFKKEIDGCIYNYFAIARFSKKKTKHLIPDRLTIYFLLKYYKQKILQVNSKNVFIQRQEVLLAVKNFNFVNICYRFAGLDNPLTISKYRFSHVLAKFFEKVFFSNLKRASTVLASGDESAIAEMVQRSNGKIERKSIIQFPTRIDSNIFYPTDKLNTRRKLGFNESATIITTSGRLAWFKGWKYMVDCFESFLRQTPNSIFYFIGDGEDHNKISEYVNSKGLDAKVFLVGRKKLEEVALYLNASDLYIMGSYQEGWSTSLSEAIACGIPACVTNFHSANEIIINGKNGFVINEHQIEPFVQGMINAITIPQPIYNQNVIAFSTNNLKNDLLKAWPLE